MFEFITVRELYEMFLSNQMMDLEGYEYVELEGWVRTNRNSGKLGFIALNDGTYLFILNKELIIMQKLINCQQGVQLELLEN